MDIIESVVDLTGMNTTVWMIVFILYIFPFALLFKVFQMARDIRIVKNEIYLGSRVKEAKISFMKGNSAKAQEQLDSAFFYDLLNLVEVIKKVSLYEKQYTLLAKRYKKLYYSMSLTPPNFEVYEDIKNIP